jgi:hypothetical protein
MAEVEGFHDAKARVIRQRLDKGARERGLTPDKEFSDAWEAALARDLKKQAGVRLVAKQTVDQKDAERSLLMGQEDKTKGNNG